MKVLKVCVCVAALTVCGSLAWQAAAEDATAKPAVKKETRGQLPAQYGKLGLSDEVKDQLYLIDRDYDEQIKKLTAEIKELQVERDTKMQEKLSESQRTQLKTLRDEAAAKRAARGAKMKKGTESGDEKPSPEPKALPKNI
jgi:TolA-binding protein